MLMWVLFLSIKENLRFIGLFIGLLYRTFRISFDAGLLFGRGADIMKSSLCGDDRIGLGGAMEHYIKEIRINRLRHLSNIVIALDPENRQHLMITGKNGSGKTSLLLALQHYFERVYDIFGNQRVTLDGVNEGGITLFFNEGKDLDSLYRGGKLIIALFPANRSMQVIRAHGVEDVKLDNVYDIHDDPGKLLHKYMVHLKTQQAYARNEGDTEIVEQIQAWFDRFIYAVRSLLGDDSITLEYDYKEYNFKFHEEEKIPFGLDELPDGYSSVIHIVANLILRMDKNWLLDGKLSTYDTEGIVFIDELETHLHIELQKKILPFLTQFFPRIQFIITTHSPYILNSIANAKVYDLE